MISGGHYRTRTDIEHHRSSRPEVFCKNDVLRNFAKFTRKHLCESFFFNKVAGLRPAILLKKRLTHRCLPVNFVKFLRTPFFIEHLWWFLQTPYDFHANMLPPNWKSFIVSVSKYDIKLCGRSLQISDFQPNLSCSRHFFQSQQWKHQNNEWNVFKVNNKDTRTTSLTSFWCLYCWLWTNITHCLGISIIVNADWV